MQKKTHFKKDRRASSLNQVFKKENSVSTN